MNKLTSFVAFLTLAFVLSFSGTSSASHLSGGDLNYTCVGQDSFLVNFNLFRDCSGIGAPTNVTLDFGSTCGGNFTATLPLTASGAVEVSQLCGAQIGQSTCNGGNLPGNEWYEYETIVVLPPCDTWTISWDDCCRNTSLNIPTSAGDGFYIETTLNSLTSPCNSSPEFTAAPIPYVCVNQQVNYNYGVVEPDGDSLVYNLISARANTAFGNLVYGGVAGVSGTNPVPGIMLDSATGQLTFTPTLIGNWIIVVEVQEFDDNGNLLGTAMRDIQFVVQTCSNQVINPSTGLTSLTGNAMQIGPNAVEVCEGSSMCFQVTFDDPNMMDSLSYTSNVLTVLPGATVTATGTNPLVIDICWTAIPGSPTFNAFSIDISDNACPTASISSGVFEVHVITSTYAGLDQTICGTQTATLGATGGSSFTWTAVTGPPLVVGGNVSCDTCATFVASPTATTHYEVVSNLSGGCKNIDTVIVNVVPDFSWVLNQTDSTGCLLQEIGLEVVPTPAGAYSYNWSNAGFLDDPTIADPTVSIFAAGTTDFEVQITSPDGCVKYDTTSVTVSTSVVPNVNATASTMFPVCGDSVTLEAEFLNPLPTTCGISSAACAGTAQITVGNGTQFNFPNDYPAPFGNSFDAAKHQILFLASELQAMNFFGGQISELALFVNSVNGATVYENLTVKMRCTSASNLSSFSTGLSTVYQPTNTTITTGWNTLTFSDVYNWDGVSNLLVEFCFDNNGTPTTSNASTRYTTTPFNSVVYFRNNNQAFLCNSTAVTGSSNQRPNMRFGFCHGAAPDSVYTYEWTPNTDIAAPDAKVTDAIAFNTTNYSVVVVDTVSGCSDTAAVTVSVNCGHCFAPDVTITPPTCPGDSDAVVIASPTIVLGRPVFMRWYDDSVGGNLIQTSMTSTNPDTITGLPAGTYRVVLFDTIVLGGCLDSTVFTITDPAPPLGLASSDTTLCIGGSASLNVVPSGGNGGPWTYQWSNGISMNDSSQMYTPPVDTFLVVTVTDTLGCVSEPDTINMTYLPPFTLTMSPDTSICAGASTVISASAIGGSGSGYTYSWVDDQGNVFVGDSITVTPTQGPTSYCVTVTDDCETPAETACIIVSWYADPVPDFSVDVTEGCYPVTVTFTNQTDPATVGTALWNFNDDGITSTSTDTASHTFSMPRCYDIQLTITSPEGCVRDTVKTDFICGRDYPTANFTFGPQPATILNPIIDFTNNSLDHVASEWTFFNINSETTSLDEHPSHTFPSENPGSYTTQLVVFNQFGCTDTTWNTVIIDGELLIYVPNAFTPNGDGINDIFMPVGEGIDLTAYELLIFDRWGQQVKAITNLFDGWDGKHQNGGDLKSGVYVWKLQAKSIYNGEKKEMIGHVNLIR